MYADKNNERNLKIGRIGYVPQPLGFGPQLCEINYNGYGEFNGIDVFELVADWNREYLANNPGHMIPSHLNRNDEVVTVSDMGWYEFYADLSLSKEEVVLKWREKEDLTYADYRNIGIDIACYDCDNEELKYPIKICRNKKVKYEDVPPSKSDPNQGFY